MSQLNFFRYQSYVIFLFILSHNDDFQHLSLQQLGRGRDPSSIVEWVRKVSTYDDEGRYNNFSDEFLANPKSQTLWEDAPGV